MREDGVMRAVHWNAASLAVATVGAAGALTLAWLSRVMVGLEPGQGCIMAPAWRGHLQWWSFTVSGLLLLGLGWDSLRQLKCHQRTRLAVPVLAIVSLLAIAVIANAFAFGSVDVRCGDIYGRSLVGS